MSKTIGEILDSWFVENQKGQFEDDQGKFCWLLDDLIKNVPKATKDIEALITEARIEELEYWMDLDPHDITWNAMHIRISELRGGR